jgi:DNA topoisomerase-1
MVGTTSPTSRRFTRQKTKHAQEAHEAIRPAEVTRLPQEVEGDGAALYALIWKRFVASQMAPARYTIQTVPVWAGKAPGQPYPLLFEARGRTLAFEGFLKVYQELPDPDVEAEAETSLPALVEGTALRLLDWRPAEHHTKTPPRFTEASLVHELERLGIGRPSTYASMVQTLKERGYAEIRDKRLVPTESGVTLCSFLIAHFPDLFAAPYTARLEDTLDAVARGAAPRLAVLQSFWSDFAPLLGAAGKVSQQQAQARRTPPTPTGESCPACGGDLVERSGKAGKFIGCMNYPGCSYTRGLEHKPVTLHGLSS